MRQTDLVIPAHYGVALSARLFCASGAKIYFSQSDQQNRRAKQTHANKESMSEEKLY